MEDGAHAQGVREEGGCVEAGGSIGGFHTDDAASKF